jgi:cohesin complex subunit SA-1/2
MDNNASQSPEADASRRRSGRVTRAPRKFTPEPQLGQNAASKRKRNQAGDDEDIDNEALLESDEDMSEDGPEDDDEHLPSRKKKSSKSARPRKPANKRVKTNGASVSGHAASLPSRPKKSVRIERLPQDGSGLYGKLKPKRRH